MNLENTEAPKEDGSAVLIQALAKGNVEVIFGYPGGAVLPIYDAFIKPYFPYPCTT